MSQLALPLQLADHAVFDSFLDSGNETLVATLRAIAAGGRQHGCWLFGKPATGKTHLLQAACEVAGDRASYIPLQYLSEAGPGILHGQASRELLCLDDIDAVIGDSIWEGALFELYNQLQDAGGRLIVAASAAPRECRIRLADLTSRLSGLPVFQLHALDEQQRVAALQLRSRHRGLELPESTAKYLLRRSRRDMASLYELLDRLDKAALLAKRRLSVAFARTVLRDDSS